MLPSATACASVAVAAVPEMSIAPIPVRRLAFKEVRAVPAAFNALTRLLPAKVETLVAPEGRIQSAPPEPSAVKTKAEDAAPLPTFTAVTAPSASLEVVTAPAAICG